LLYNFLDITLIRLISGCQPDRMRGSKTGVFVGASGSEAREGWSTDPETLSGYTMSGGCTAMFANRLSYFFDFKGEFQLSAALQIEGKSLYSTRG
jgi:fatty acid synthase